MVKSVKEILKTMTTGRMQADRGDHTVMTCPNLELHFNNLHTND